MKTSNYVTFGLLLLAGALLIPSAVHAQSTGAVAGSVEDTTEAALPGVTVEVSGPALIEGLRAAITDGAGNYTVTALPPGTYSVTFGLPGFSTVVREGVEVTTGFTANVAVQMQVGGVEETITVTGASPVVDIQNTAARNQVSIATIEALPVGRTRRGIAELTLGAASTTGGAPIIDQGGSKGDGTQRLEIHGMRGYDQKLFYDGMWQNNLNSGGSGQNWMMNQMAVQEVVMGTSTASAESESAGMTVDYIPKDGSNQFATSFIWAGTWEDLQADNLSQEILDAGVTTGQKVKRIWDYGIGVGGPFQRDRMWFYSSFRAWGSEEYQPNAFYNKSDSPFVYEADETRRAFQAYPSYDASLRVTWQAAERHKFNFDYHIQNSCQCFLLLRNFAPPASAPKVETHPAQQPVATWTYAPSNSLLFEAGASYLYLPYDLTREDRFPDHPRVRSLAPFIILNGSFFSCCGAGDGDNIRQDNFNQRFSVSYVTGSHNFEVGQQWIEGYYLYKQRIQGNLTYDMFGDNFGRSFRITQSALPVDWEDRLRSIAFYAQDQWTMDRLTLNLGIRYDHTEGWAAGGEKEATDFLPAFSYDQVSNVPNYNDITPRVGVAYDLFGDGRTAIKGSFGRYLGGVGNDIATANNPEIAIARSTNRSWTDTGNFVPDCDLTNFAANGECGAIDNLAFGSPVRNTFYSTSGLEGWNVRASNWQANFQVQQELSPGVALNVGYFLTTYKNFFAQQNRLVTAADYDPFCITAPSDPRLPNGGGNEICGLFDINPAAFGRVENLVTNGDQFGDQTERYDGVDIQLNARLPRGGTLQGGVSIGRKRFDNCSYQDRPDVQPFGRTGNIGFEANSIPRTDEFCDLSPPWGAGTQIKASGNYPLPWGGLEPSFTFQSLPGRSLVADTPIPSAAIEPSLGRPLAGRTSATVVLIPSDQLFIDRVNTLNVAVAKTFELGGYRLKGRVDVYNLFNDSTVLNYEDTFGSRWQQPTAIIGGRLLKFQAELDF